MKLLDKEILFEDNHLLIIDKPPGLLTLPADGYLDSAVERGKAYLKEKYEKPGDVYLHQVHRLDRSASGILVMAKTTKALSRMNEQIREGKWKKMYLLQTERCPAKRSGKLLHYLKKEKFRANVVTQKTLSAKEARLSYRVREDGLIEVDLETGRYHQIRAQFAAIGCPICGDKKYGAKRQRKEEGIALHHYRLTFIHPISGELITIHSRNCRFS